jgi:hypothetical protein
MKGPRSAILFAGRKATIWRGVAARIASPSVYRICPKISTKSGQGHCQNFLIKKKPARAFFDPSAIHGRPGFFDPFLNERRGF